MKERNYSSKRKHGGKPKYPPKTKAQKRPAVSRAKGFHFSIKDRILVVLKRRGGEPISVNRLAGAAQISSKEKAEFWELLNQMIQRGELTKTKNGLCLSKAGALPKRKKAALKPVKAQVITITEKFGFAKPESEDPEAEDIFLPGRMMMGAMPGDVVLIQPEQGRGSRMEGTVVEILEENNEPFTGVITKTEGLWQIIPDKNIRFPLHIEANLLGGAKEGDKVLAQVCTRGSGHFSHKVKVCQIFGSANYAENCCQAVLASYHARTFFDEPTLAEARKVVEKGIPLKELEDRLDLTGLDIFTIDSADSKDLDDAVSLEKTDSHWELGVHIADVSHYIKPNSPLDKEAYQRATSIYYADQVLPMLPKEISNGICSLNPDEVRLTFSALVTLNFNGEITGFRFVKSYIRSRVKGVYKEINTILDGSASPEILEKYHQLIPQIHLMRELAAVLMKNRFQRGSMDIDSMEPKFIIENGRVVEIQSRERGESERIIEEFMLTANQAAATLAMDQLLPFVYRVHSNPPAGKVEALHEMLLKIGMEASAITDGLTAKDMANVLAAARGTDLEQMVNNQLLRTMAKAVYSEQNIGHFGLVLKNYAHFTSPIRRYPDLIIHRILSSYVGGAPASNLVKRFGSYVGDAAKHCSDMELNAVNIERDCEDCYKAEYMSRHLGEEFQGVITTAASFGFYVQLPNSVEGLVHVRTLPQGDYTLEDGMELVENLSNTRYCIGQKVIVCAVNADVSAGQVDFELKSVIK